MAIKLKVIFIGKMQLTCLRLLKESTKNPNERKKIN
jgi:hypothetical protein